MRYRLPAAAVVGVVGLLVAAAAGLGVATSGSRTSGALAFARSVLAQAVIPPGGAPTNGIHTLETSWLGGWGPTTGIHGVDDVHAFYLYDEPARTVVRYVKRHLPPGNPLGGIGSYSGIVSVLTEPVPVSGPDEFRATLTYSVAPTNGTWTSSELRIDAKTVWVPPRPARERAPTGRKVEVTGFRSGSPRTGARGPVTVVVPARRARRLVHDLNSLPLGAQSACLESVSLWSVRIEAASGNPPSFTARSEGCDGSVAVTMSGKTMSVLTDRSCAVLRDVAALLPPRAHATRWAGKTCAEDSVLR